MAAEIAHRGSAAELFLPGSEIHGVRTVGRQRDQPIKDAGGCIQHMQKARITMNLPLHNAISDLSGQSGQAIIRAILSGQRDPGKLAALRHWRIPAREEAIIHSLRGNGKTGGLVRMKPSTPTIFSVSKSPHATASGNSTWSHCLPGKHFPRHRRPANR
jgi:hypothetical protein